VVKLELLAYPLNFSYKKLDFIGFFKK